MKRLFQKKDHLIYVVAGFCLLLIILIWANIIKKLEADEKKTISTAIQRNSNLAVALEQYAIRTLNNADDILQLVRSKYQMEGDQQSFRELLKKEFIDLKFYSGILIINEKGRLAFSNVNLSDNIPQFLDRKYFQFHANHSSDRLHINEPLISRILGRPVVVLSRRISKSDGSFGGVVAVHIEPATFTKFYANANLGRDDIMSLISPNGITYARRTGHIESYGEDISASPLFTHVARNPIGNYFAKDAIRNIHTYFSYRKLEQYPVIATVGTSEADVLAEYNDRVRRLYVFGSVITILLICFALLIRYVLVQREKSLKKTLASEAKYRSIFENSLDSILLLQPDGKIEDLNDAAREVFRIPEGKPAPAFFHQLYLSSLPSITLPVNNSDYVSLKEEVQFTTNDKIQFTGEVAISSYKDSGDNDHLVIIINDITLRKQMEARLLTDQKNYQQELTRQIIHAQEMEREVIGHELHDNVNQILTTVKLYLEIALKAPDKDDELLRNSIHHIMECIGEIRNLSRELSAPTLDNQSLIESIKTLLQTVESSSGLTMSFIHDGYHTALVKEQRLAIYRILQEQLNNIIKHAGATEVQIVLSQSDGMTTLNITDNGKGFDTGILSNGIGLNNILSRCKIFNGQMLIDSEKTKGCRLQIILPVKEEEGIPY